jgi:hypothetical protein
LVGGGASTGWDWAGSDCRLHFFDERAEVVGCEGAGLTPTVALSGMRQAQPLAPYPYIHSRKRYDLFWFPLPSYFLTFIALVGFVFSVILGVLVILVTAHLPLTKAQICMGSLLMTFFAF